ncbi:MAG: CatB-related O-acetyltransferase [Bacteroidota bacterium]
MVKSIKHIIKLLENLFQHVFSIAIKTNNLTRYQLGNPSCKFYPGVDVSNSNFEGFNVLFQNVVIMNCEVMSHSYIQKNSIVLNAKIGKFCSIASNVTLGTGSHKIDSVSTHPSFFLKNTPLLKTFVNEDLYVPIKHTSIGHDVWIGDKAVIVDGVKIGNGAIIAAGAIVTKDVEPYSIVGGVPAKHIKYRFDEKTILRIEKSKWWDYTDEWFQQNHSLMIDNAKFITYIDNCEED